ncbi:MAG: tRNA pseudouridine(55) synthase TruB [Treponema sp.]|nr:tRNA pseudouridine(55) synthase TruB [Treponema sp.]
MKTIPSGLILLHKLPGITSFDALSGIKRSIGSGKAGHTGTLDKFAEGLLLALTGKALKLSRWFTHCDKQYEGIIRFGCETDTLDPEGAVIANAPLPSREAVEQAIAQFTGIIEQEPPAYSAIHINGERASNLARRGDKPEMQKRPVNVYSLELRSWQPPFASIFVHCSGGTYIRSLARDIALAAGSRGSLSALLRTQVAGFRLKDACSVSAEGSSATGSSATGNSATGSSAELKILPINKKVMQTLGLPCIDIAPEHMQKISQGKPLAQILKNTAIETQSGEKTAALLCGDALAAIIEQQNSKWNYGYVNADNKLGRIYQ